jgi:hypothetical protein
VIFPEKNAHSTRNCPTNKKYPTHLSETSLQKIHITDYGSINFNKLPAVLKMIKSAQICLEKLKMSDKICCAMIKSNNAPFFPICSHHTHPLYTKKALYKFSLAIKYSTL